MKNSIMDEVSYHFIYLMMGINITANMDFICETCDKQFASKQGLVYHVARKACKNNEFYCKYCNSGFTLENSMYRHMKHNCNIKKQDDEQKNEIYVRLLKLEEENKKIAGDREKDRMMHKKEREKERNEYQKEIESIKKTVEKVETITAIKTMASGSITKNTNNGNIVNGDINNNINIILVGYGREDISKIDTNELIRAVRNGYHSSVKLTETLHFNPKYPEYHNVYISNMRDKYAMMFDGNDWVLTIKEDLINKIYDDKKNYIEENWEDFVESLTVSRKKALERWLETADEDAKIAEIKEQIKMLLYNKRNIPIKTTGSIKDSDQVCKKSNAAKKRVYKSVKE